MDSMEVTPAVLTIGKAANLIASYKPELRGYRSLLPDAVLALKNALAQAIRSGDLSSPLVIVLGNYGPTTVDSSRIPRSLEISDNSMVEIADVIRWCDKNHFPHGLSGDHEKDSLPAELCAAIDAFDALRSNPALTNKRTPKSAVKQWLKERRPELSENARERIATVVNWQPQGGAPKTLG